MASASSGIGQNCLDGTRLLGTLCIDHNVVNHYLYPSEAVASQGWIMYSHYLTEAKVSVVIDDAVRFFLCLQDFLVKK